MPGKLITAIQIATCATEEDHLQRQELMRVSGYLDEESTFSLWYKKTEGMPITRIQFSFNESMSIPLIETGFTKVRDFKNITMWYMSGRTEYDIPITDKKITNNLKDEIASYKGGWERLGCDLNRFGVGKPKYMWVMRQQQSYICDLGCSINYEGETELFKGVYICIDEDTNRGLNPPGSPIFLFYRHSMIMRNAITDIKVSLNEQEESEYKAQSYTKLDENLKEGTHADPVHLWYKRGGCHPIKNIFLLVGDDALYAYQKTDCTCIPKNLNRGTNGTHLYIAFKQ